MTPFRYYVARLGQAFGLTLRGRYASNAAAELHLLSEAEEVLGRLVWEELEGVDNLSVEYWNLRRITKESAELAERVKEAKSILQQSHEFRSSLLKRVVEGTEDFVLERESLIEKSEELNEERDAILQQAKFIKRRHDGVKAKLEVLGNEGADPQTIADSHRELDELKSTFRQLRLQRDELATRIAELDKRIEDLNDRIEKRRSEMREEAFGAYQNVGKVNRELSQSRAELGILESEMSSLFRDIGRYLTLNKDRKELEHILRPHRALVGQMRAVRHSVRLNTRLAGRKSQAD